MIEPNEKRPTIVFDDKEYFIDELNDKELHFVSQIKDVKSQMERKRHEFEQLEVAMTGFTNLLGEELEKRDVEFIAE